MVPTLLFRQTLLLHSTYNGELAARLGSLGADVSPSLFFFPPLCCSKERKLNTNVTFIPHMHCQITEQVANQVFVRSPSS